MAIWKIEPTYKKSVIERIHYYKGDKEIVEETGWRWGEFTIETDDDTPPVITEGTDLFDCEYSVQMEYCDDGCWTEYEFIGFTEEEEQAMNEWLEENSFFELEEEGWISGDTEMILNSDAEIEKIE